MGTLRLLTAEFLGTFGLVFFGAGAIITDQARNGAVGLLGIALAHALALSIGVTMCMRISGGHLNPAVTFALWLANKIEARTGLFYILAQLAAAVVAAFALQALFPGNAGQVTGLGVPRIASDIGFTSAILIEAILTFFLVSAVFGTAVSPDAPPVGGFGIGLTLIFAILAGGPLTGAALNPARAFGPALVAGEWVGHAVYWIGPLLGGAVAALVWGRLLLPEER